MPVAREVTAGGSQVPDILTNNPFLLFVFVPPDEDCEDHSPVPHLRTMLVLLPRDVWLNRVIQFLTLKDLVRTDSAMINHDARTTFLNNIHGSPQFLFCDVSDSQSCTIAWRNKRKLLMTNLSFKICQDKHLALVENIASRADHVTFQRCTFLQDESLIRFLNACSSSLENLSIESCSLPKAWPLQKCALLKVLILFDCGQIIDDDIENNIANCPSLHTCYIHKCIKLTVRGIGSIVSSCPALNSLDLDGGFGHLLCDDDQEVPIIAKKIQKFSVRNIHINYNTIKWIVASMPNLTQLSCGISGLGLSDPGVATLARGCPQLTELSLFNFAGVDDAALVSIGELLPEMRKLTITADYSQLSDVGVISMAARCSNLTDLNLSASLLTNASIQAVGRCCRKLERLYVTWCYNLTDDAFDTLNEETLQVLDVSQTSVTGSFATRFFRGSFPSYCLQCNACPRLAATVLWEAIAHCVIRGARTLLVRLMRTLLKVFKRTQ